MALFTAVYNQPEVSQEEKKYNKIPSNKKRILIEHTIYNNEPVVFIETECNVILEDVGSF